MRRTFSTTVSTWWACFLKLVWINLFKINKCNNICVGFNKTNREISTAGGEVIYLFFQKFILQTFRFYLNKIYLSTDEVFDRNLVCKINFWKNKYIINVIMNNKYYLLQWLKAVNAKNFKIIFCFSLVIICLRLYLNLSTLVKTSLFKNDWCF